MSLGEKTYFYEILHSINEHKLIPFLGAGMAVPFIPLAKDLANELAKEFSLIAHYDYPLEDTYNLSKVTEFISFEQENTIHAKEEVCRIIKYFSKKCFPKDITNTNYSLLTNFDFPLYITTNYDLLLEETLKSQGKEPVSEFCLWNKALEEFAKREGYTSVFDNHNFKYYDINKPIVYHLHGIVEYPHSLLLTESDYIDFLVHLNQKGEKILPRIIQQLYINSNFLYIGYSLQDVNVRVLIKSMPNFLKNNYAVFPSPPKKYLQKYIGNSLKEKYSIQTYWGNAKEFLTVLQDYFKNHNPPQSTKSNKS
jgi:SIR2-like domain